MNQVKRSRLSAAQRTDVWRRWKAGESLHEIGRAFSKPPSCIHCLLVPRGGIAPAARVRSRLALSLAEREDISRGIAAGSSIREIAIFLDRAASTVSREVTRHGGHSAYRAHEADSQAWKCALRPKRCLLARNRKLRKIVANRLVLNWSPEQISGWLETQYPDDEAMRVSHETIYRSLFIQARGVLKKELMEHLRSKRCMRHCATSQRSGESRRGQRRRCSLNPRKACGSGRPTIAGHWEGDLLSGAKEQLRPVRRAPFTLCHAGEATKIRKLSFAALSRHVRKLPATLRRSLTWDRGLEMAKHKAFTRVATDVKVYFCDPQSPWQRGTNENTNRLLRQYFPRGTDLSPISQAQLDQKSLRLNQRPRKTLGFQAPASRLQAGVAFDRLNSPRLSSRIWRPNLR